MGMVEASLAQALGNGYFIISAIIVLIISLFWILSKKNEEKIAEINFRNDLMNILKDTNSKVDVQGSEMKKLEEDSKKTKEWVHDLKNKVMADSGYKELFGRRLTHIEDRLADHAGEIGYLAHSVDYLETNTLEESKYNKKPQRKNRVRVLDS